MTDLISKRLLLVAPHFNTFIKDQVKFLKPHLSQIPIVIPIPQFSKIALSIPYFGNRFGHLRWGLNSITKNWTDGLYPSEFFSLPVEIVRKRNHHIIAKSCLRTIKKNTIDFDFIHAHFLFLGYTGVLLKDENDVPLIITAHGGDIYLLPFSNPWYKALAKSILKKVDITITVSKFNASKLYLLGVPKRKVHVIPNGYDDSLFRPIPKEIARSKLGLPQKTRILISVGQLIWNKNHELLITAMVRVLKKYKDSILIIIGPGPLKQKLREHVRKLQLVNRVFFIGGVSHREISLWMNAADIFVLPSIREGFPTVLIEALACGKPIVATRVGGIPEAVSSEEVGILAEPENLESLTWSIFEALEQNWNIELILEHAKKFSLLELSDRILDVYKEVL